MRARGTARIFRRYILFVLLGLLAGTGVSGSTALATYRLATNSPPAGFGSPPLQDAGQRASTPQTGGPSGEVRLDPPSNPEVVLYDQYNNPANWDISSQDFEPAYNVNDDQAADDFIIPSGQLWQITQVEVNGEYSSPGGPASSFNVYIYQNSGTLPGTPVYTSTNQSFTGTAGDAVITLSAPATLNPGTYWVSVQARQDFGTAGQWYWQNRVVQSTSPATWRNPGGGFGTTCTNWGVKTVCIPTQIGPDQVFRLSGTSSTVATSTPTRTPTACPVYTIMGSITAGDPIQAGRLQDAQTSICGNPTTCPGQADATPRHYDDYTFINTTTFTQCVRVVIDTTNCTSADLISGNKLMDSVLYLGRFNASNSYAGGLCNGYLADMGGDPSQVVTYSVYVPAGQVFSVVVNERNPNSGCNSYRLTVSGCVVMESLTPTPTPTGTSCSIDFSDVHTNDYFYEPVRYLYCAGAISGYQDNTFRPFLNTTRGQLSKIVVLAEAWALQNPAYPTFSDVPADHAFYRYVETAYAHGIIAGYGCGGPGEPCPGQYFRPFNNVTRGQLCKIIVLAESWSTNVTGGPHFQDVPTDNPFYDYIETAYNRAIVSGYNCGGEGEPCPGTYFRWGANAIRGQISKIVYNAVTAP